MILEKAKSIEKKITELRRILHQNPEIGYKEFETQKILIEHLELLGLEIKKMAGTGIVANIKGKSPGKTVALRADMDALPIKEENDIPYKSLNDGFMHACGHDAHMSMVYGAALILNEMKDDLNGNVRLIFQPAEEGGGGARKMIEEGAIDDVNYILGMHVWPDLQEGKLGLRSGPFHAASDTIHIEIIGKGGHAAHPDLAVDPIMVSAKVIDAIHTISSREIDPLEPFVITVGSIKGGTAANIIPDKVELIGTVRTTEKRTRGEMEKRLKRIISGITSAFNANFNFEYIYGYPVLVNDPKITDFMRDSASKIIGKDNVIEVKRTMGGEDFAFYLEKIPGTFMALGTYNEKLGYIHNVHTSKFNFNEKILHIGSAIFAQGVMDLMHK